MAQGPRTPGREVSRQSPVMIGLLSGILVAVVILIAVVVSRTGDKGSKESAEHTTLPSPTKGQKEQQKKEEQKVAVKNGESQSREQAEAQGIKLSKPSNPVDAERLVATYEVGKKYRSLIRFELKGRGTAQDWGIQLTSNFFYVGELQATRAIESNNGTTLVLTQTFDRAENLQIATQIENLDFLSPGPAGELTFMFADWAGSALLDLPAGWSKDIRTSAQLLADTQVMKNVLSQIASDNDAKVMAFLSSLQGKRVRITYVNGKGVEKIEPLGCDLTEQERNLVFATAAASDIYVLPDLNQMKEPWTIRAQDVLPVVDPSFDAHFTGEVSASREPDEGTGDDRKAVVGLKEGGYFELEGFDKNKNAIYGRWMPTGKLLFSYKDKIVTSATLAGSFALEQHSTNHWIFEARLSTRPTYTVTYSGTVAP